MVPIRKNLVSPDRYWLKCPYTMKPTRIVVHNTGNDAPAINEVAYMVRNDEEPGFHVAVDDVEIVQGIPFDRNAWNAGDGHGKGNMEGISIEICYSKGGGARFIQAEKNAAEYIASLLKEFGWGMERVTKHQDYNGKDCPHRTLDMGWDRFLKMVQKELDQLNQPQKEETDMTKEEIQKMIDNAVDKLDREWKSKTPTYNSLSDVPGYWREDIRALVEQGVIAGEGPDKLGLTRSEAKSVVLAKRMVDKGLGCDSGR